MIYISTSLKLPLGNDQSIKENTQNLGAENITYMNCNSSKKKVDQHFVKKFWHTSPRCIARCRRDSTELLHLWDWIRLGPLGAERLPKRAKKGGIAMAYGNTHEKIQNRLIVPSFTCSWILPLCTILPPFQLFVTHTHHHFSWIFCGSLFKSHYMHLPSGNQTWQWKMDHWLVIFLLKPPSVGDFPASHVWWDQRIQPVLG